MWPHRWQPTRLSHPWDFPGKSTGVGCHCLLHHQSYIKTNFKYRYICFSKVYFTSLCFFKRPTLVPDLLTERNPEGFHFCNNNNKKEWKVKIVSRVCFAGSLYALGPEWDHQALYQETRLGASTSRHHNFELCQWTSVIYLDLFCKSISKICPKNCSLHYAILAYERLQRNALPLDSGGNL